MRCFKTEETRLVQQAETLLYEELFHPLGLPLDMQEQLKTEGVEHYFVAVDGDNVIGTMVLVIHGTDVELHHAAVSSSYRGRGIGSRLWEEVLAYCSIEHLKKVNLYSRNTAIAFWRSLGFMETSDAWLEAEMFVKHGIRHKQMERDIS